MELKIIRIEIRVPLIANPYFDHLLDQTLKY